jgi:hypothetical protein
MKQRDNGLVSRETMMAFGIIVTALIGYVVYVQGPRMMESFKGNKGNTGNNANKVNKNASPHAYPVVCLAGNSKIPCTAFSSG